MMMVQQATGDEDKNGAGDDDGTDAAGTDGDGQRNRRTVPDARR